ncbi:hypothetical protein ACFL6B_05490 [Thermodesulfobacteriota bacterium]
MNWKIKLLLLLILSVPAFSGYPINMSGAEILPGITYGWVLYFIATHCLIPVIIGVRHYSNILSLSALVSVSVIFVGGTVSYLIFLTGLGHGTGPFAYSSHYVSLCLTILTVVPLALSIVAIVPFHEIEYNFLINRNHVSKPEKSILMFLRVFNHIVHFVIPNILEVMREEAQYRRYAAGLDPKASGLQMPNKVSVIKIRFKVLIRDFTHLGVEGICSAIQYIPLWAIEISQLPDKKNKPVP